LDTLHPQTDTNGNPETKEAELKPTGNQIEPNTQPIQECNNQATQNFQGKGSSGSNGANSQTEPKKEGAASAGKESKK
jgi:hypothetical protein